MVFLPDLTWFSTSHVFQWPSMPPEPSARPSLQGRGSFFFLCGPFSKSLLNVAQHLLLFHVLAFWMWGMCDPSSPTRNRPCTPCIGRWSSNCWISGDVPRDADWHGLYRIASFWPKETLRPLNRDSAWTHPLLVQPSRWVCFLSLLDPCLAPWARGPFWKTWLSPSSTQEPSRPHQVAGSCHPTTGELAWLSDPRGYLCLPEYPISLQESPPCWVPLLLSESNCHMPCFNGQHTVLLDSLKLFWKTRFQLIFHHRVK